MIFEKEKLTFVLNICKKRNDFLFSLMKKHFSGIVAVFALLFGISSASAVYVDYYGNTYQNSRDFLQNYMKNNRKTWTAQSMVHLASQASDEQEETVISPSHRSETEEKEAQRIAARTNKLSSGSLMKIEASGIYPRTCPNGWVDIDIASKKIKGTKDLQTMITSCYSPKECSVMQLEETIGEPAACPESWEEAGMYPLFQKTKFGLLRTAQTRTCYQCKGE